LPYDVVIDVGAVMKLHDVKRVVYRIRH